MSKKSFSDRLLAFAEESNRIEEIYVQRRHLNHAAALEKFVSIPASELSIDSMRTFVSAIQPNSKLRTTNNDRVWIGGHEALPGAQVVRLLSPLLVSVKEGGDPLFIHQKYENIHPFIDGNGRSGRALWLWQMINQRGYDLRYGFLRMYYYQTLAQLKIDSTCLTTIQEKNSAVP